MNVAIVGSRDYSNKQHILEFILTLPSGTTIVSGGARGVDTWAEQYAIEYGYPTITYPAQWKLANGSVDRGAGFKRNKDIITNATHVVAFWDGKSHGTLNSIQLALKSKHVQKVEIVLQSGLKFEPSNLYPQIHNKNVYYATGNLLQSNAKVLVNPCNTIGVYGAGISHQFANDDRFKWFISDYARACRKSLINVGVPYLSSIPNVWPKVLHFPTKGDWKYGSKLSFIRNGLFSMLRRIEEYAPENSNSFAFPMLGCGRGGLDWFEVEAVMLESFHLMPEMEFVIYIDNNTFKKSVKPELKAEPLDTDSYTDEAYYAWQDRQDYLDMEKDNELDDTDETL